MKILIMNWRDIKHPAAGGAEELTFEVARRWCALDLGPRTLYRLGWCTA